MVLLICLYVLSYVECLDPQSIDFFFFLDAIPVLSFNTDTSHFTAFFQLFMVFVQPHYYLISICVISLQHLKNLAAKLITF